MFQIRNKQVYNRWENQTKIKKYLSDIGRINLRSDFERSSSFKIIHTLCTVTLTGKFMKSIKTLNSTSPKLKYVHTEGKKFILLGKIPCTSDPLFYLFA